MPSCWLLTNSAYVCIVVCARACLLLMLLDWVVLVIGFNAVCMSEVAISLTSYAVQIHYNDGGDSALISGMGRVSYWPYTNSKYVLYCCVRAQI